MSYRLAFLLPLAIFLGGCAKTQLNNNTAELASSLTSLVEKQVFYNLAQSFKSRGFIPSQVTLSNGSAQTTNTLNPSVSIPLAPVVAQSATATAAAALSSTAGSTYTYNAPGLTVGVTNTQTQNWSMSPMNDAGQVRRLRALYNYVTGQISKDDFVCDYPVQSLALPLHSNGGNVAFARRCNGRVVYADPNFVRGHDCVLCDVSAGKERLTDLTDISHNLIIDPQINPRLVWGLITSAPDDDHNVAIGEYEGVRFYLCDGCKGPGKIDGRKAFSDFVITLYEALSMTTGGAKEDTWVAPAPGKAAVPMATSPSGGSGKAPSITPFIFSVPIR